MLTEWDFPLAVSLRPGAQGLPGDSACDGHDECFSPSLIRNPGVSSTKPVIWSLSARRLHVGSFSASLSTMAPLWTNRLILHMVLLWVKMKPDSRQQAAHRLQDKILCVAVGVLHTSHDSFTPESSCSIPEIYRLLGFLMLMRTAAKFWQLAKFDSRPRVHCAVAALKQGDMLGYLQLPRGSAYPLVPSSEFGGQGSVPWGPRGTGVWSLSEGTAPSARDPPEGQGCPRERHESICQARVTRPEYFLHDGQWSCWPSWCLVPSHLHPCPG